MQGRKALETPSDEVIYQLGDVLVYKKKVEERQCVIKKVKVHQCSRSKQEMQVCRKIQGSHCENLVEVLDCWESGVGYYIQMQHYPYNLQDYLKQKADEIARNPRIGISIFVQICHGIVELRQLGHVHRDLKCSNILLKEDDQDMKVVIADFAECNRGEYLNNSKVGTDFFMAPEIKAIRNGQYYDNKVDMWSLGIILFQIFAPVGPTCHNSYPIPQFPELNSYLKKSTLKQEEYQQLTKMMENFKPIITKKVPKVIRNIMHVILDPQPKKRLGLQEICSYLNENRGEVISYFDKKGQSKISRMLQKLGEAQLVHPYFEEIERMRSLYRKFYLPLVSKMNLEKYRYRTFYLFLYNGVRTLRNMYETNLGRMKKKEILIKHVFGSVESMKSMLLSELKLKNELNSKYSDQKLNLLFGQGPLLLNNQNLKQFLLTHFTADEVEALRTEQQKIF